MAAALLQNANLLLRFLNSFYAPFLTCPKQVLFLPGSVLNPQSANSWFSISVFFFALKQVMYKD